MRTRAAATIAALLAILALTGCGGCGHRAAAPTATGAPSGGPAASASPAGSPSASATPSAIPLADLTQQVNKARIATISGSRFSAPDRSGLPPLDVCGGKIDAYQQVKAVNIEIWIGMTGVPMVKESVFGFQSLTGADVVAQARTLATACASHTQTTAGEVLKITRVAGPKASPAAGVDAYYTFCETQTVLKPAIAGGVPLAFCTAVLGRGHVAVFLNAGQSPSLSAARTGITRYLPAVAKALIAAVPAA